MKPRDPEFFLRMNAKLKAVHTALEDMLAQDPTTYTTEELVQVWATLDFAYATMRGEVFRRPDVAEFMARAVSSVQSRLL